MKFRFSPRALSCVTACALLLSAFTARGVTVAITATNATASEAAGNPGMFTITRDTTAGALTVNLAVSGTAIAGLDYPALAGSIAFASGEGAKTITVAPVADFFRDANDTVTVTLSPNAAYTLGTPASATVTITDTTTTPFSVFGKNPLAATPGGYGTTRSVVSVSGPSFAQALRIVTASSAANVYEAGYSGAADLPLTQAVNAGDVLVVSFWARAVSGDAQGNAFVRARIESTASATSGDAPLTFGAAWRFIQMPVTMAAAYASGGARLRLFTGYGPQTLEIGGIRAADYGAVAYPSLGLPFYEGREANATWRAAAEARIEATRKGDLSVQVRDLGGNAVPFASVHVQMKRPAFGFGSAVQGGRVLSTDTADAAYVPNQTYRDKIRELFHWAVLENDLKWFAWEPAKDTITSATALGTLDWLRMQRLGGLRGHNLIWPRFANMPAWLATEYSAQIAANGQAAGEAWLRARVTSHISGEAAGVGARVDRWDVLNEPFDNHELQDLYGRPEIASWFATARAAAPSGTARVLNDYGNHGEDLPHIAFDIRTITETEAGQPTPLIDAIGLQAHVGIRDLPGPDRVLAVLDRYAALGKQIEITEFTLSNADEQLQADYLRDYLTVCFSHPAVKSFLLWGFWANALYDPTLALYRADWTPTLAAGVWSALTKTTWWTDVTVNADANGNATVRGFHGEYEITATNGPRVVTGHATLGAAGANISLVPRDTRSVTLSATADAYARDGANAATNYGATDPGQLVVKANAPNNGSNREAFLKFDLASVPEIFSAKLRLSATLSVAGGSTATHVVGVSAYAVSSTTWSETTLNWNNRPTLGAVLDYANVTGLQPTPATQWVEFDVTEYLRAEKAAGRNAVALALHDAVQSSPLVAISSREAANSAQRPQLVITTSLAPTVTVIATTPNAAESGPNTGVFTFLRTGDPSVPLTVTATYSGTALRGTDFSAPGAPFVFPAGMATLDITATPIPDTLAEGSETIVLTLATGIDYTPGTPQSASVVIADKPMDAWKFFHGIPLSPDTADADRDGRSNLVEWATGTVPTAPDRSIYPQPGTSGGALTLTYQRLQPAAQLQLTPEVSSDLQTWNSGPAFLEETLQPDGITILARDLAAPPGGGPRFIRLRVTRTD